MVCPRVFAKADATYNVAKEKCDDKAGNAKDVCVQEAKAIEVYKEMARIARDGERRDRQREYGKNYQSRHRQARQRNPS